MDLQEFVDLVAEMRRYQKSYFTARRQHDLELAKEYEKKVDDAIRDHDQAPLKWR